MTDCNQTFRVSNRLVERSIHKVTTELKGTKTEYSALTVSGKKMSGSGELRDKEIVPLGLHNRIRTAVEYHHYRENYLRTTGLPVGTRLDTIVQGDFYGIIGRMHSGRTTILLDVMNKYCSEPGYDASKILMISKEFDTDTYSGALHPKARVFKMNTLKELSRNKLKNVEVLLIDDITRYYGNDPESTMNVLLELKEKGITVVYVLDLNSHGKEYVDGLVESFMYDGLECEIGDAYFSKIFTEVDVLFDLADKVLFTHIDRAFDNVPARLRTTLVK